MTLFSRIFATIEEIVSQSSNVALDATIETQLIRFNYSEYEEYLQSTTYLSQLRPWP